MAGERLGDGARAVFDADYVREHLTLGYAVTVHSAHGVTTDSTHAVLGETATRSLFYVAMTRGRDTNTTYLYERAAEPDTATTSDVPGVHRPVRGSDHDVLRLVRGVLARDDQPVTAHQIATDTHPTQLPEIVAHLITQQHTPRCLRPVADRHRRTGRRFGRRP